MVTRTLQYDANDPRWGDTSISVSGASGDLLQVPTDHSAITVNFGVIATACTVSIASQVGATFVAITEDIEGTVYPRASFVGGEQRSFRVSPGAAMRVTGTGVTYSAVSYRDKVVRSTADVPGLPAELVGRASLAQGRPGNNCVFLGDSITKGSDDAAGQARGMSWPLMACMLSGQRIRFLANAGVSGNTSAQMLARVQADVVALNPSTCFILAGTNDIGGSVTLPTFQSNIRGIVSALRSASIMPILLTIPPNNDTAKHAAISAWNQWLRRYCLSSGITLVDIHAMLVDPATAGNYLAGFFADATHPSSAGYLAIGQHVASVVAPLMPVVGPQLLDSNLDPNNMLAKGLFLTDGNSDGIADSWAQYGSKPADCTVSLVTDALVAGNMQRIANVATASAETIYQQVPGTAFSVGDRVLFTGVITSDGGVSAQVQLYTIGGAFTTARPLSAVTAAMTRGVMLQELVIPAGTTAIDVRVTAGAGTGTLDFGQIGFWNLTRMGVL